MAKIDLKAAYRSVCIHLQDRAYSGLKWIFTCMTLNYPLGLESR